ncbi:serine/threonine protein kinase [Roseateles sp. BYS78W]|uniref:non-specific serine/threonine protein kinase n=1 Tax=Pelomonas candidula TaxID=3299025 RepID=A0ABW7H9G9_9BURK
MTAAPADDSINALPPGTRFGELEILGTLGVGGFGIVYLARDHSLEREVAIKEYMPSQFAQRDGQSQVSVRSMSMRETFEVGRRSFVNEARLLARFDHPSLLKVYRFWEANGTAYMAMPRLVGQNLREARRAQATPPPEAWVRRVFDAVLGGLEALHAQHVWHRDVAPDNIFMPADGGPPILLDFGAARQAIGDRTQIFTAILKPSFAPIEQYAEATTLKQGPWTDFYALAAVMHDLLTGRPPPPCTARAMGDELAPLSVHGYSPSFLAAIDWALRVPPHQRPPNAAAWRDVIEGRAPVPAPQAAAPRPAPPAPVAEPAPAGPLDIEFADTVQALPEDLLRTNIVAPLAAPSPAPAAAPAVVRAAAPKRGAKPLLFAGAGVLAVVLLGLFVVQLRDNVAKNTPPAVDAAASAASAPLVLAEPASAVPAPASTPPAVAETAVTPVVVGAAMPPRAAPASTPAPRPTASTPPRREGGALKPPPEDKPAEVRPMPRSPVFAAPEPVASAVPVAAASAASTQEPRTAAEACGRRVLLARAWCIDRQCEKPQFRNDPECVKLREIREQRNNLH